MSYKLPTSEEIKSVDLSWKRYLLPKIHKEGVKILVWMALFFLVLGLLWDGVWYIGLPLLCFSYYFFRNPTRVPPEGDNLIIAPADGIISNIKEIAA